MPPGDTCIEYRDDDDSSPSSRVRLRPIAAGDLPNGVRWLRRLGAVLGRQRGGDQRAWLVESVQRVARDMREMLRHERQGLEAARHTLDPRQSAAWLDIIRSSRALDRRLIQLAAVDEATLVDRAALARYLLTMHAVATRTVSLRHREMDLLMDAFWDDLGEGD